ncbi:UNVERIFIED_CONTAM: hypothetical protein Scaly_0203700 [Sesamum calycinum]|uniref:Reverse transcriptase domain-containing protein n=1 Tax=Sesamum calycinum TaxID=2727403 RepID=A0AAW2SYE1_9LAMI
MDMRKIALVALIVIATISSVVAAGEHSHAEAPAEAPAGHDAAHAPASHAIAAALPAVGLQAIQSGILSPDLIKEASDIREELEKLAAHEETFWKQRGKALWLKEGDRNTTFFHKRASHRFRTNLISKLKNSTDDIARGTENLRRVVDTSMEEDLLRPYSEDEVTKALFQMAPLKSPGPDGMPPIFFQKFWRIVKHDVTACVLHLLNSYVMPPSLNETNIVLIPKCKNPINLTQFRPISLCNVVYKIASKTVANRLKLILDHIISPAQSAFVPHRLITDNILLAFELNHFLNTKTTGKQGYMAMKLDVSKAYDKVEWAFLEQVMAKLGFPSSFLRLIMLFVSSVSYSFMKRWSTIRKAEMDGRIRGVSICRNAPYISHLLFADDTLIFSKASSDSARHIKEILEIYRMASGQEINFQKSSVAFSKNCCEEAKRAIVLELEIRTENKMELYLGLPSRAARSKKELFSSIRDKVWKRINGWKNFFLKQARKSL